MLHCPSPQCLVVAPRSLARIGLVSVIALVAGSGCPADAQPGAQPQGEAQQGAQPKKKAHVSLAGYAAYDEKADGAGQIEAAGKVAKASGRRVLVVFGGNWCKWCRALDGLFAEDAAVKEALDQAFVVVHVNSDTNVPLNQKYGNPFQYGFPVLVVLDADGKKLHVQESGSLEMGDQTVRHDPAKVLIFLKQWAG